MDGLSGQVLKCKTYGFGNNINKNSVNNYNVNNTMISNETPNIISQDDASLQNRTVEFDISINDGIYGGLSLAYCAQSIKIKTSFVNRGITRKCNIGICRKMASRIDLDYLRNEIYKINDKKYLQSTLPTKFNGKFTKVFEDIIAKFNSERRSD
eukprot:458207_1